MDQEPAHVAPQEDIALAFDAGHAVNRLLSDPDSALSKFRTTHPDITTDDLTTLALEIAETEAQRRRTDLLLAHLHILNREGIESLAIIEALKIEDKRPNAAKGIIVVSADANGLKLVNDLVSHAAGDDLLRGVGAEFRNAFRETDILGHPSGDEFFALLIVDNNTQVDPEAVKRFLEGTDGILTRFHQNIETFRTQIKQKATVLYGKPWPEDTTEKRPGTVSVGWHYFSSEEYLERYQQYRQSTRKGYQSQSFTKFLETEAEARMYEMKRQKKTVGKPHQAPHQHQPESQEVSRNQFE